MDTKSPARDKAKVETEVGRAFDHFARMMGLDVSALIAERTSDEGATH